MSASSFVFAGYLRARDAAHKASPRSVSVGGRPVFDAAAAERAWVTMVVGGVASGKAFDVLAPLVAHSGTSVLLFDALGEVVRVLDANYDVERRTIEPQALLLGDDVSRAAEGLRGRRQVTAIVGGPGAQAVDACAASALLRRSLSALAAIDGDVVTIVVAGFLSLDEAAREEIARAAHSARRQRIAWVIAAERVDRDHRERVPALERLGAAADRLIACNGASREVGVWRRGRVVCARSARSVRAAYAARRVLRT